MELLVSRLFTGSNPVHGPVSPTMISQSEIFREFQDLVDQELVRQQQSQPSELLGLAAEQQNLVSKQTGWMQSLANPQLHSSVRDAIQKQYAEAAERISQLELLISTSKVANQMLSRNSSAERVAEVVNNLGQILMQDNPSRTNLELARHIDSVRATPDGRVRIRMAKLGFLTDMCGLHLALQDPSSTDPSTSSVQSTRMATRPRRLIPNDHSKPWEWVLRPDYSLDPHRYDHLSDEWFWVNEFVIPVKQCWSEAHAIEVAESLLERPCGRETLAKRFGVSKPTIDTALRHAKSLGVDATHINGRYLRPNWAKDHAQEVAGFFQQPGATMAAAEKHFGMSDAWIRKARKYAETAEETTFGRPDPPEDKPNDDAV